MPNLNHVSVLNEDTMFNLKYFVTKIHMCINLSNYSTIYTDQMEEKQIRNLR